MIKQNTADIIGRLKRGERGKDREVSRTLCSRLYLLHVVLRHSRPRVIQENTGETRGSANRYGRSEIEDDAAVGEPPERLGTG
jgi:hypothetical protein